MKKLTAIEKRQLRKAAEDVLSTELYSCEAVRNRAGVKLKHEYADFMGVSSQVGAFFDNRTSQGEQQLARSLAILLFMEANS